MLPYPDVHAYARTYKHTLVSIRMQATSDLSECIYYRDIDNMSNTASYFRQKVPVRRGFRKALSFPLKLAGDSEYIETKQPRGEECSYSHMTERRNPRLEKSNGVPTRMFTHIHIVKQSLPQ